MVDLLLWCGDYTFIMAGGLPCFQVGASPQLTSSCS